jgi:energy-coupling factor transport system ATP-binding protein
MGRGIVVRFISAWSVIHQVMIEIQSLTYAYPNTNSPALQGINWKVQEGDFILVAGPSGSGKSTLLRTINGLVPHFNGGSISGQIRVHGINPIVAGPGAMSRHVGFVGQDPESQAVYDEVESEIVFPLENAAIPPMEMRIRLEETLDLLDLTHLRSKSLINLSGGERQRVAIAAALSLRPSILVLDEPTSQLDPQSAEDVLRSLVRLNEDLGLTIVLAEHRLERILRYVDRITYLEEGKITIDAPVQTALSAMPIVPPLIQLARTLGWNPLPVTIRQGKKFVGSTVEVTESKIAAESPDENLPSDVLPVLSVRDLNFAYNGHHTLHDVSLIVNPGEAVALIGRNGAGKSTLLKCIVGLLPIRTGTVQINGRPIKGKHVAEICREVAYLPQYPDDLLYAETVREEFLITLRNHNLRQSDRQLTLIDRLGLSTVADRYPRDLSVGQRQRVALGAVTITEPNILLLDEPTRGLDFHTKEAIASIWRHWLDNGAGLLLVTHDVELVAMLADRTIVLSQGEVIASGNTHEVLSTSPHFAPQIARLFPGSGWLTAPEALEGLHVTKESPHST